MYNYAKQPKEPDKNRTPSLTQRRRIPLRRVQKTIAAKTSPRAYLHRPNALQQKRSLSQPSHPKNPPKPTRPHPTQRRFIPLCCVQNNNRGRYQPQNASVRGISIVMERSDS